ncbi:MAG: NADPH-dependent FMN reductase [Chloroflexi bacterium]|jgi:multimeric flavodoxin WrbA|nr:NADPH-dependent FMN reductase [Chloroflexota bacterium]
MKKVTAFVGSARKKHTHDAAAQFLSNLQAMGDVEVEIVRLSDYRIETCRGCKVCFEKGEAHCPLKDDRDVLIEKMMASDGVVFASPNYAFQVSALMKTFLDRLAFICHRPRFFGKTFTSIVAQGIYGGNKIVKYLDFLAKSLGFNVVKGRCITTLEPMTEKQQRKIDKTLAKQAQRYYEGLEKPDYPSPNLIDLMFFRMGRTKMKLELDDSSLDYRYYADKGWFDSDFYYPTRLGPLKKGAGAVFDWIFTRMSKAR